MNLCLRQGGRHTQTRSAHKRAQHMRECVQPKHTHTAAARLFTHSDSKGTAPILGCDAFRPSTVRPALTAAVISATCVK
jgi:hypothetical protein